MNFQEFKQTYQKVEPEEFPNNVEAKPLVSICVQTFQHVDYIKDCLEGILAQKTTFPFEILLGEDDSLDGTRDICIEYAEKNQEKIRLFLQHRQNNIKIEGQPTGRFNFLYNVFSAKGKYIALCEGDDYWTDPLKLEKQVGFLEENEEYGICFHTVKILNEETSQIIEDNITKLKPEITNILDLARGNFIHTPSVVLRNNFQIPEWYINAILGDWTLYMIQIKSQKIKCFYEKMAIYRIHNSGMWSSKNQEERYLKTTGNIFLLYKNGNFPKVIEDILNSRLFGRKIKTSFTEKFILKIKNMLAF